jgi:2-polyprenyl-3-methyl-5-hydroxy-6-metoxy-1,4-benzoquinol methylase
MSDTSRKQAIAAYEQAYSASDFEVIQARYRKKLLLALLDKMQPKRLLEVGCGWETIANHWPAYEQLTIVEPGANFAEKARVDTESRQGVTVVEHFLEDAVDQLKQQSYDLILVSSLLHEVPDPAAILQGVKDLCHAETLVHVNVPNARSMHRLLAVEMGLIADVYTPSALQKTFQQPRIFDLTQLQALAEGVGFKVAESGSFLMKPFTHGQMMSLVENGFMSEKMLDGLWHLTKYFPDAGSEIYVNLYCGDKK